MPKEAPAPIQLPPEAWTSPAALAACRARDATALLRLARRYGVTNERLAYWTGIDAGEISKRLSGNYDSPVRTLDRWERLAEGLSMPTNARMAIGLAPTDTSTATDIPEDFAPLSLDLIRRLEASDVGPATLDALAETTDRLCRAYPSTSAHVLRAHGQQQLRQVVQLHDGRATLAQRRELLVTGGWLALLIGCVEYDMGLPEAAESTRRAAFMLGREAGHGEIVAWSYEIAAWMALTRGNYQETVEYARAGASADHRHSVSVQLAAQEAKGWARLGELREMEAVLDLGRTAWAQPVVAVDLAVR